MCRRRRLVWRHGTAVRSRQRLGQTSGRPNDAANCSFMNPARCRPHAGVPVSGTLSAAAASSFQRIGSGSPQGIGRASASTRCCSDVTPFTGPVPMRAGGCLAGYRARPELARNRGASDGRAHCPPDRPGGPQSLRRTRGRQVLPGTVPGIWMPWAKARRCLRQSTFPRAPEGVF